MSAATVFWLWTWGSVNGQYCQSDTICCYVQIEQPPVLGLNTRVCLHTYKNRASSPADYFSQAPLTPPEHYTYWGPSSLPSRKAAAGVQVPSCHTATHGYQSQAISAKVPGHPLVFFSMHLSDLQDLYFRFRLPFFLRPLPKSFWAPHLLSRTLQAPIEIIYVHKHKVWSATSSVPVSCFLIREFRT